MTGMAAKAIGGLLIAFGAIWAFQGLGLLNWPQGSAMLAQREWAVYGGLTAALGAMLIWLGMKLARNPRR